MKPFKWGTCDGVYTGAKNIVSLLETIDETCISGTRRDLFRDTRTDG